MSGLGVHIFPKDIRRKVNIIAQLEFELAFCDVTVHHVTISQLGLLKKPTTEK